MGETFVTVGDGQLCAETFGDPAAPSVLLISGAAASMDWWDDDFCLRLADGGLHVIRYDHRDTGKSVTYPPGKPGYTAQDLTQDAVAVIDQLAGGRAHLVGISMGGGIAQDLAIKHPAKVASLTLLSTSPVGRADPSVPLPPMDDRLKAAFADPQPEPDWSDPDAVADYFVDQERLFAAPAAFDEDRTRAVALRVVARSASPASSANHWAVAGGDDEVLELSAVTAPTLVIHGREDPLFPPAHGVALAEEIDGAELLLLDGVGHQMPPPSTWDVVVPAIIRHTRS